VIRVLAALLLAAAGIYGAACFGLYLAQERLVWFPDRALAASPADAGLDYREQWITTADGVRLHAWYLPGPPGAPVVLFLHGNAGNLSHRVPTLSLLSELGAGVLIVSYRGYGLSGGEPGEQGTYHDAQAAHDHLTGVLGVPARRIVVHGRSLGGAVASWLAVERECGALVLESTFTSVPDLAAEIYPLFPVRLLARIRYDTLSRIASVRCPVLVVHGRDDEVVPFRHGRRLFEAAPQPRAFLEIPGGHNDSRMLHDPRYREALRRMIEAAGRR